MLAQRGTGCRGTSMAPNLNTLLIATAIIAAFLIERGNRTRITAPDRSATLAGTIIDAQTSHDSGRTLHSIRDPLF